MNDINKLMQLLDQGKIDEAQGYVNNLPEDEAFTWYLRGKVKSRLGLMSEAMTCYNQALHIDPNYEEAKVMIEISQSIFSFKDPNLFNH